MVKGRGCVSRLDSHGHDEAERAPRARAPAVPLSGLSAAVQRADRHPCTDLQDPTDSVRLAVRWRLREQRGVRDVAERLLQRGFEGSHEPIRAWECRAAAPGPGRDRRARRRALVLSRARPRPRGGLLDSRAARPRDTRLPGASCGAWSTWPSARRSASRRRPIRPTGGRSAGSWGARGDTDAITP